MEMVHIGLLGLAKLASSHLLLSVVFIMDLLGRGYQIQHVATDQEISQLLKIAMLLVLDFSDTPRVLTTENFASVWCAHSLCRSDNGEGHCRHDVSVARRHFFIVALDRA